MATQTPSLRAVPIGAVTCKLCAKVFARPLVDPTKTDNERLAGYIKTLVLHLKERHPAQLQSAQLLGAEYAGMLHLQNFDNITGDVAEQREYLRAKIHAITRRAFVPDDRIVERVRDVLARFMTADEMTAALKSGEIGDEFIRLMQTMRDVLTEKNTNPWNFEDNPYYQGPKSPA